MFLKGQKVVCINDTFDSLVVRLYAQIPRKDSVYTVRSVYVGRGNVTREGSGQQDGEIGILLEEIVNPRDPALKQGLNGELGFNSERFAPLEYDEEIERLQNAREDEAVISW